MAEIRNYTMNFGSDVTCLAQVSLRRNARLESRVVVQTIEMLRAEVHG
jgi:hypothetical protein